MNDVKAGDTFIQVFIDRSEKDDKDDISQKLIRHAKSLPTRFLRDVRTVPDIKPTYYFEIGRNTFYVRFWSNASSFVPMAGCEVFISRKYPEDERSVLMDSCRRHQIAPNYI